MNAERVAAVADNIANVLTPGYRTAEVQSVTVVTDGNSGGGSVRSDIRRSVDVSAFISASPSQSSLAIEGNGFFAVADASGAVSYTRDGSFQTGAEGNLVNAGGYTLLGYPTDGQGNATGALQAVNLGQFSGAPEATQNLQVGGNLPADAPTGSTYDVTADVFDSQGGVQRLTLSFTKLAAPGAFELSVSDPTSLVNGAPTGTTTDPSGNAYSLVVNFDADGGAVGLDLDGDGIVDLKIPPALTLKNLTGDESEQRIQLDFTGAEDSGGLTSFAGPFDVSSVVQDGNPAGQLAGYEVTREGTVIAAFDNGARRPVYQIPVAEFSNPNGLSPESGNSFQETSQSGAPQFRTASGDDGSSIVQRAIEGSNTDLGSEFARLILAETAYRANISVVQAAEEQSRELINLRT